jgi:hypothetical protein
MIAETSEDRTALPRAIAQGERIMDYIFDCAYGVTDTGKGDVSWREIADCRNTYRIAHHAFVDFRDPSYWTSLSDEQLRN